MRAVSVGQVAKSPPHFPASKGTLGARACEGLPGPASGCVQ